MGQTVLEMIVIKKSMKSIGIYLHIIETFI